MELTANQFPPRASEKQPNLDVETRFFASFATFC